MSWDRLRLERQLIALAGGVLAFFLVLPILALLVSTSWRDFHTGLVHPLVWPALRLSLFTTLASLLLIVVFGTPLAWALARSDHPLSRALETLVQLPIVTPPAVAGVALLLAFGRRGLLAGWLYPETWAAPFTTTAVVMAEVFVSAPFFIQAAISAFRRLDEPLLVVARTFGAGPLRVFFRIALPLASPALLAGASMSWARALGEFGATLMFAGNLEGKTQTLPLAIYASLEADVRVAQALSVVLVAVALGLLLATRALVPAAAVTGPLQRERA